MKNIIFILLLLSLESCSLIFGFRKPSSFNDKQIIKTEKKYRIKSSNSYKIDSKKYLELCQKYSTDDNYKQPLQLLVFDSNQIQITNIINCKVGGFPILKWNRFGSFDSIPVKQNQFTFSNNKISENEIKQSIIPLKTNNSSKIYKYRYYVFWSTILHRNTKVLIKQINKHLQKDINNEVEINYIFIDELFL